MNKLFVHCDNGGNKTRRFTLIELLICIAVIGILAALLMPALSMARERANRVACMNNQRQFMLSILMRAEDYEGKIPSGNRESWVAPQCVRFSSWNWRKVVNGEAEDEGYVENWDIWGCPSVPGPPIDDPRNRRRYCYANFSYFPGRSPTYTHFGDSSARVPLKISALSGYVIMQDNVQTKWVFPSGLWYNHGTGGLSSPLAESDNPSLVVKWPGQCYGANLSYIDGSVHWVPFSELVDVGRQSRDSSARVFSLMPEN